MHNPVDFWQKTSWFAVQSNARHEKLAVIQEQIQLDGFIRLNATEFKPGDRVAVEQGPSQGWIGEVQREQKDGKWVMILLETIQHARLLVEKRWLSAVAGG